MGAGILALVPDQTTSAAGALSAIRSQNLPIPRKAVIPAALSSFDQEGKIDYDDFYSFLSTKRKFSCFLPQFSMVKKIGKWVEAFSAYSNLYCPRQLLTKL